jgi:hypothetical protein
MLALPYRIRESGRGFTWLVARAFGAVRRTVQRGRDGTAPEAQPAE